MRRLRPALLVGLALLLGAASSARAAPTVVAAGPLRAELGGDPWRLRVRDARGRDVLVGSASAAPSSPGTLGFRIAGRWRHATRLLSGRTRGRRFTGTLATDDPQGRRLRVSVAPAGAGVLGLAADVMGAAGGVEAVGAAFEATRGERYLGFGERSDAVVRAAGEVEDFVAEGPYQPEERPLLGAFIPPWAFRPTRRDASSYPVAWLLSTAGHGVLVDGGETSAFSLGRDGGRTWSVAVTGPPAGLPGGSPLGPRRLRLRIFAGPTPAGALRRMTAAVGRQPAPTPEVLGPWYHSEPGFGDERAILAGLQAADVPLSVGQIYTQYLPCAAQRGRRARQRARVDLLHGAGLAATTYVNPLLCPRLPEYAEGVAAGALTRRPSGEPYSYEFSVRRDRVAQFDFSAPAGRALFGRLAGEALQDGHDGWMEDYGEYSPLDARSADGTPGPAMHNEYPTRYHCAARDAGRRAGRPLIRYVRSGWIGTAPCAPVVWGGDPTTDWGYDGLASAVRNGLSMGLSGVSTWGSDIGGFFAFGERRVTPELLARWIELGAVSGVMRAQETGIAVPVKDRPRTFEPATLPVWRRYAKLRTQLYPYVSAAAAEYRRSGLPIMRHLALVAPGDRRAVAREDELLFGPDLLAAPVHQPGARRRSLYLPEGEWVDLWRAARYDERSGALGLGPEPARVRPGRRTIAVPAPLAELPLLVRAGAVLALLPSDVTTLSGYGQAPGIVHERDRRDRRTLLAFPRGRSSSALGPHERVRSLEEPGRWRLRIDGVRPRRYRLEASLSTMRRPFPPCQVRVGARTLPPKAWSYDQAARTLTASFKARTAAVEVDVAACRTPSRG